MDSLKDKVTNEVLKFIPHAVLDHDFICLSFENMTRCYKDIRRIPHNILHLYLFAFNQNS